MKRNIVKLVGLVAVLVLAIAATGTADEPQAVDPSAIACGDSANCNMAGTALKVTNAGAGEAIYGENTSAAGGMGVRGKGNPGVYGTSVGAAGVRGVSVDAKGVKGESTTNDGVYGKSVSGHGVYGESSSDIGVYGKSSSYIGVYGSSTSHWSGWFDNGIRISDSPWHGIEIDSANWAGVWVQSAAYAGVEANGNKGDGVWGVSTDQDGVGKAGVHGYATGGRLYGVLGQDGSGTDVGWALRTAGYPNFTDVNGDGRINDDFTVDGTCIGCALSYLAQNADGEALVPGDVVIVSGVGEHNPSLTGQRPLLLVRKKTAADVGTPMLAVVLEGAPPKADSGLANNGTTADYIPSGGYLVVATRGQMARLKVETSAGAVQIGDALTAAPTAGYAMKAQTVVVEGIELYAPDSVLGRALEPLADSAGEIWVLLTFQ